MSIATEISRLTSLRNSIRTKLIALGILSNAQADLQDIYDSINGITGSLFIFREMSKPIAARAMHIEAIRSILASVWKNAP